MGSQLLNLLGYAADTPFTSGGERDTAQNGISPSGTVPITKWDMVQFLQLCRATVLPLFSAFANCGPDFD